MCEYTNNNNGGVYNFDRGSWKNPSGNKLLPLEKSATQTQTRNLILNLTLIALKLKLTLTMTQLLTLFAIFFLARPFFCSFCPHSIKIGKNCFPYCAPLLRTKIPQFF